MNRFRSLLSELPLQNRERLNDWFYHASDEDLIFAISVLNSSEVMNQYSRNHLKEYTKFARLLLRGELPEPPSNLDLSSSPNINFYNFAQGSYQLIEKIQSLIKIKYQQFFKLGFFLLIIDSFSKTDSRGMNIFSRSKCSLKITRPIASFTRIINSRCLISIKIGFQSIKKFNVPEEIGFNFKTKAQKKKIMKKCVIELIKKGRVNLEQRAFWRWAILLYRNDGLNISEKIKEDFLLLKLLGHSANLRYFHGIKHKFDVWKDFSASKIGKIKDIEKNKQKIVTSAFKIQLKKGLSSISKLIHFTLNSSFASLTSHSKKFPSLAFQLKKFESLKPNLRNLLHIFKRFLLKAFTKFHSNTVQYEYQYEEIITTEKIALKRSENYFLLTKPIVLFEFHESSLHSNKVLLRNLVHMLKNHLQIYFYRWVKYKKPFDLNFSTEETLDLSMFKLPFVRSEKLRTLVNVILSITEIRNNLPKVILSTWMQRANKRSLTISTLRLIIENQRTVRESKKAGFTAFELAFRYQTEFTDIT